MQEKTSSQPFGNTWRDRLRALRNVPPGLRIVWEAGPRVAVAGLLMQVLSALVPIGIAVVSAAIIGEVASVVSGHQPLSPKFWWLVAAEFALALGGSVLSRTIDYCDSVLGDKFIRHVSIKVMDHASKLDLETYEDPDFYDKLERARVQATDRVSMIQAVGRALQQFVTAVTFSITICFFSPWILLLLIMGVLPAFVGESHFAFLGYSLRFRQTPARRQIDYLRVLGASKESAKELKLFGLSKYLTGRYARLSDEVYTQNVSLSKRRLLASSLFSLLSASAYYGAYAFVIYRTVHGDLSLRSLVYLAAAIAGASSNIQQVFSSFTSIADQALFLTDFLNLFRLEPKVKSKPDAIPAPRPIRYGFEFEGVTFAYPGTTRPVLDGLDLRIEPGQRVALVGENGQGKTTLVKLITRLYDPTSGRILLDGVDLRDYDLEDLHREIAVIFQDFMRYEMTGRENIAMGKIEEVDNFSRLSAAARKSLADAVLHRLPGRYEQMLGRRFEGGVDLSGGEWQKIALARAYLRDAQLLILDEPTAALDARSEREVFERFSELTTGKTALLISHRFSTVRMADRILVLEGGQIVEDGCHSQLMARGERYSQMFELQASSYR
ncbi:MAG TPA: ABC transporter ATP-binding protein [Candidatus Angelobacter sp.]|nr:ABC transporter ATP-binding protein [Candidatus Angelobacter sp.]